MSDNTCSSTDMCPDKINAVLFDKKCQIEAEINQNLPNVELL